MSASMYPRRSARIASMTSESDSVETVSAVSALSLQGKLDAYAAEAFHAIRLVSDILKVRAAPDETTANAIVWLTRLSWAIEDCREYKTRQLATNCDETVMDSIPKVLDHLRSLTTDATCMMERFKQHATIPHVCVMVACELGASIKDALYII
jgi:hypothetical protein